LQEKQNSYSEITLLKRKVQYEGGSYEKLNYERKERVR